jgi:hypothetical protein
MDPMADTTAISIVGIVASGGFGLAGAWIATRAALKRLRLRTSHERGLSDLAELRTVLDDGAEALRRAMWEAERVVSFLKDQPRYVSTPRRRRTTSSEVRRLIASCHEAAEKLALVSGRIALRLGREHDVFVKYDQAIDAYTDPLRESLPLFQHPWRWSFNPAPRQRSLEQIFERGEEIFRERRRQYIVAALGLVGSRLDGLRTGMTTWREEARGPARPRPRS